MSPLECDGRLATTTLGRIGVIVSGRPEVFPVCYVLDARGYVTFPTHAGTKLASALDWPWVGFEIDGIDENTGDGWSVMVVGKAEELVNEDTIFQLRQRRLAPWRASGTERWLRVVPTKVTGRKISASDW
jgi:nitroimidazol reductase NimA-like FMN-containing flavoprotein (pyridoxamine 5'-phosphate oxidase superfamily)